MGQWWSKRSQKYTKIFFKWKHQRSSPYTPPDNGTNCSLRDVYCYCDTNQENGEEGRRKPYTTLGMVCFFKMDSRHHIVCYHGMAISLKSGPWCLRFCKPDCLLWTNLREDPGHTGGDGNRSDFVIQRNECQNGKRGSGFQSQPCCGPCCLMCSVRTYCGTQITHSISELHHFIWQIVKNAYQACSIVPGAIGERAENQDLALKHWVTVRYSEIAGLAWASEFYVGQGSYGAILDRRTVPLISAFIGPF